MNKILFVDDEENILQGLKRMLRPMRKEWDMHFVNGGENAINTLKFESFNAVVTDMRMPVIDGLQVLEFVKSHDPSIARVVLSGQTDFENTLKLTGTAHQFISKPCESDQVIQVLKRAFSIRDMLNNPELEAIIAEVDSLPSLPDIYTKLTNEMEVNKSDFSLAKVADIVSKDISMSAKILQLSNSSFFGFASHIESVHHAVMLLGSEVVRTLCIGDAVFKEFSSKHNFVNFEKIWEHSLNVSTVATALAKHEKVDSTVIDQTNQAGILHGVGKLIVASSYPDKFEELSKLKNSENSSEIANEKSLLGASHGQIGAYLLCLWGLPDSIVEAVGFYQDPVSGNCTKNEFAPLVAVHVANALTLFHKGDEDALVSTLDNEWLMQMGFENKLEDWVDLAKKIIDKGE